MPAFPDWLARVLADGESSQDAPPSLGTDRAAVTRALQVAFDRFALDVSGPPLPFDQAAAIGAALVLANACWLLVGDRDTPPSFDVGVEPASPAAHLSADVTLRLLPAVFRRAQAAGHEPLTASLEALFRRWPLSGVLADLDGLPTTLPEFGGHSGLQMLYAERLAATGRVGWVPPAGPARDRAERVFSGLSKPLPAASVQETPGD